VPIIISMTKVPVLPGVWWVEIPQAGLRILCGAPMDSIKHLMRLGLVKKIEKDGVVFEQGPNAILLSDVSIQNGQFWNLAEFPVLHMLYRQGMVIPGHPGNTGLKPILTGLPQRAEAVLSYIYRGTYGLVTKKEMLDEGIPEDQLEELWRLKLKFASGGIKSPHELVDVKSVKKGKVRLSRDVTLIRDSENQYTFKYRDETVSVDMNLPEDKDWTAPYTLNNIDVPGGYFSINHIGEGNGWDPERPCMGSIVTYRGNKYLIDAGPGIDYSLEALGCDIAELQGLFVTHVHDDHFAGLTCLLRGDRKLNIFATRPVMATVRYKCAALLEMEPDFLDNLVNIHYLEEGKWNDIDGLEVRPAMSPHPLETTILFFRALWEGGYKSYAHLADIISKKVLTGFVSEDGVSEDFKERVFAEYYKRADIKKIDVGRGLIHGFAEDFVNDPSDRIILSHTEGSLSSAEKEIGASVSFGQVDILIPDRGDRLRDSSASLLERTFPGLPEDDFKLLINGEIQSISPGTRILKRNSIPDSLALIITGTVDALDNGSTPALRFTAGSIVGEEEFLSRNPAQTTYRSRNHVKVLRIPADIYVHALNKSSKMEQRMKILETRFVLYAGKFPGSVVSCPRLDELAAEVVVKKWKKGKKIPKTDDSCYILTRGTFSGNGRTLKPGDWIYHSDVSWTADAECLCRVISSSIIREIPVLSWTLEDTRRFFKK